jgi:hypothetical protein
MYFVEIMANQIRLRGVMATMVFLVDFFSCCYISIYPVQLFVVCIACYMYRSLGNEFV